MRVGALNHHAGGVGAATAAACGSGPPDSALVRQYGRAVPHDFGVRTRLYDDVQPR